QAGGAGAGADLDADAAEVLGGDDGILVGGVVAEHQWAAAAEGREGGDAAQCRALVGGGGFYLDDHLARLMHVAGYRARRPGGGNDDRGLGFWCGAVMD